MKDKLPLPKEKKLFVTYRVEPGCLGPQGKTHIEAFCHYAQKEVESVDSDYVHWDITPRFDKSLDEIQYNVLNKNMTHVQAEKYLQIFGKSLDEFEGHLGDKLDELIELFMAP